MWRLSLPCARRTDGLNPRMRLLPILLLLGCGRDKDPSTDDSAPGAEGGGAEGGGEGGEGGEGAEGGEGGEGGAETGLPDDPSPFTLSVTGAMTDDLVFDDPSCTWTEGANFRMFWRNKADEHVFVLGADVLGVFASPGTYTPDMGTVRVILQEEAGGTMRYFASDTSQGDIVSITVDAVSEDEGAWGEFTFSALHNEAQEITATPQPLPIWCASIN